MKTEAEMRVKLPQAEEYPEPAEATQCKEGFSFSLWRECIPVHTLILDF